MLANSYRNFKSFWNLLKKMESYLLECSCPKNEQNITYILIIYTSSITGIFMCAFVKMVEQMWEFVKFTYLEPLKCCCVIADLDRGCFMATFLSGCDLCSLLICLGSVLFGIDDVEPLELCLGGCCCCGGGGGCCCCDDCELIECGRIDGIFGIPLLLLLLLLLLLRDGIGPFELLFEDLDGAPGGKVGRSGGGILRSPRSFLCGRFELDPDAVLIDDDDACCIIFWCDDEEDL